MSMVGLIVKFNDSVVPYCDCNHKVIPKSAYSHLKKLSFVVVSETDNQVVVETLPHKRFTRRHKGARGALVTTVYPKDCLVGVRFTFDKKSVY